MHATPLFKMKPFDSWSARGTDLVASSLPLRQDQLDYKLSAIYTSGPSSISLPTRRTYKLLGIQPCTTSSATSDVPLPNFGIKRRKQNLPVVSRTMNKPVWAFHYVGVPLSGYIPAAFLWQAHQLLYRTPPHPDPLSRLPPQFTRQPVTTSSSCSAGNSVYR